MRLPNRVVGDYHVDRQDVQGQQWFERTCTNGPKSFFQRKLAYDEEKSVFFLYSLRLYIAVAIATGNRLFPIPNREAKPVIADGTARPGGRVGSCRSSDTPDEKSSGVSLFICHCDVDPLHLSVAEIRDGTPCQYPMPVPCSSAP